MADVPKDYVGFIKQQISNRCYTEQGFSKELVADIGSHLKWVDNLYDTYIKELNNLNRSDVKVVVTIFKEYEGELAEKKGKAVVSVYLKYLDNPFEGVTIPARIVPEYTQLSQFTVRVGVTNYEKAYSYAKWLQQTLNADIEEYEKAIRKPDTT